MKNCKKCNTEFEPQKGLLNYCSLTCRNSRIQTEENNKKRSKKLKKEKVSCCNSCGDIVNRKNKYCNFCIKRVQDVILYKKLDINESNLKKANNLAIGKLLDLYFNQKLSLIQIRNKFNIMYNTVHFFFKKNGINLRNLEESSSLAYEQGRSVVHSGTQYKQGWHTTWNEKKVYYHSSYELDYAKELDENRLDYDIESLRIKYLDTQKNKIRIAIPDFYLPESNTIVEIKSNYTFNEQNLRDKFKKYKELGYNVKLILEHKEIEF